MGECASGKKQQRRQPASEPAKNDRTRTTTSEPGTADELRGSGAVVGQRSFRTAAEHGSRTSAGQRGSGASAEQRDSRAAVRQRGSGTTAEQPGPSSAPAPVNRRQQLRLSEVPGDVEKRLCSVLIRTKPGHNLQEVEQAHVG
jgi:hypothetical protein